MTTSSIPYRYSKYRDLVGGINLGILRLFNYVKSQLRVNRKIRNFWWFLTFCYFFFINGRFIFHASGSNCFVLYVHVARILCFWIRIMHINIVVNVAYIQLMNLSPHHTSMTRDYDLPIFYITCNHNNYFCLQLLG